MRILLGLCWLVGAGSVWAGSVALQFEKPEQFTDASFRGGYKTDPAVLRELQDYFEKVVAKRLPAGLQLKVQIRDLDMAGQFEPWRPVAIDVRQLRSVTWPRIRLSYSLRRGEEILVSGVEDIKDMDYLNTPNRYFDSDRLRYEKAMLDAWYRQRLQPALEP